MAWQQYGERRYYYRSIRRGAVVHKDYFGAGQGAQLAASIDALAQTEIKAERETARHERKILGEAVLIMNRLDAWSDLLLTAALLAPASTVLAVTLGGNGDMEKRSSTVPAEPAVGDELRELVQLAQSGDPVGLVRIREVLDNDPTILEYAASLTSIVERIWRAVVGAEGPGVLDKMLETAAKMRRDLIGDSPSRIEKLLGERAIANWMEIDYLRRISADAGQSVLKEECTKRLDSAYRRHGEALEQLMTLRELIPRGSAPEDDLRIFHPEPDPGPWGVLDDIGPLDAGAASAR